MAIMTDARLVERITHGEPSDEIWQQAIALSELIERDYPSVLQATLNALSYARHADTVAALSTCLLEHILERNFAGFDGIEEQVRGGDDKLLYALSLCSKFGVSKHPENASRWDTLLAEFRNRLASYQIEGRE
jgi:hypothetical protein